MTPKKAMVEIKSRDWEKEFLSLLRFLACLVKTGKETVRTAAETKKMILEMTEAAA